MKVRIEGKEAAEGKEALGRLDACRVCVDEGVQLGGDANAPQSPIYSLRSCAMFLRATGVPCSGVGMKGR